MKLVTRTLALFFLVPTFLLAGQFGHNPGSISGKAEARELIFNSYVPRQSSFYKVWFEDFAKRIEASSNGSITVNIPGATLAPPTRQLQIVKQGIADVASVPRFSQRNKWKLMRIAELPFNSINSEASSIALNRTYEKYFKSAGEFKGVKLLSLGVLTGRQYVTANTPIKSIKDFKGLKMWAPAGPLAVAAKVTGATVVPAPFPKLFEFASKGTIDGMIITRGSAFAAGVSKYSNHMLHVPGGIGSLAFALVMNESTWKSLSAAEKAAVEKAAVGLPTRFGRAYDKFEAFSAKKMNVSVVNAGPAVVAELNKKLNGLIVGWLKSAAAAGIKNPKEVLAYYRAEMAKVGSKH